MTKYPTGKGLYVWKIGGHWDEIVFDLLDGNFDWVAIKIADGPYAYNDTDDTLNLVTNLRNEGLQIYGWQYNYLDEPEDEAIMAARKLNKYNLDGFILDPEAEAKGKHTQAELYMNELLSRIDLPIGLSSYRWPSYHPSLPWREFLDGCTFHAPQVYWVKAHNPGDQLKRSVRELQELKDLPVIPAGSAYCKEDWCASDEDVWEFLATAKELGLPGIFYWAWHCAPDAGVLQDIKDQVWEEVTPDPEPDPPEPEEPVEVSANFLLFAVLLLQLVQIILQIALALR